MICHEQYAGQTANKFSTRWSSHRSNWNNPDNKYQSDQKVLSRHYSLFPDIIHHRFFHENYNDTPVEQLNFYSVNTCEAK